VRRNDRRRSHQGVAAFSIVMEPRMDTNEHNANRQDTKPIHGHSCLLVVLAIWALSGYAGLRPSWFESWPRDLTMLTSARRAGSAEAGAIRPGPRGPASGRRGAASRSNTITGPVVQRQVEQAQHRGCAAVLAEGKGPGALALALVFCSKTPRIANGIQYRCYRLGFGELSSSLTCYS